MFQLNSFITAELLFLSTEKMAGLFSHEEWQMPKQGRPLCIPKHPNKALISLF